MGGIGSGNWYPQNKRTTVEECKSVDVRYLQRNGVLSPGKVVTLSWTRNSEPSGSIYVLVQQGRIVLVYNYQRPGEDWQPVEQPVTLMWTPCNYGGSRAWFMCPGCGRRVAVLYAGGRDFLCRRCYRLSYASQQESARDRLLRKARKIRERLGGSGNLFALFPDKPKRMHWSTYERLSLTALDAEQRMWAELGQSISKRKSRLDAPRA